jgi:hypothetical protein
MKLVPIEKYSREQQTNHIDNIIELMIFYDRHFGFDKYKMIMLDGFYELAHNKLISNDQYIKLSGIKSLNELFKDL